MHDIVKSYSNSSPPQIYWPPKHQTVHQILSHRPSFRPVLSQRTLLTMPTHCHVTQTLHGYETFCPVNPPNNGVRGGAVGWGTALQAGGSRVRFLIVSLEFYLHNHPGRSTARGLTVDSASNGNEYQEYFLAGKGGRWLGLTNLHFHVLNVLKYWGLNFLEHSRPDQNCNGIALPLL